MKKDFQELKTSIAPKNEPEIKPSPVVDSILKDLVDHINSPDKDFSSEAYNLAMQIKSTSTKAYEIIVKKLGFPSSPRVDAMFNEAIEGIPEKLTDLTHIGNLFNLWKDKHGISKSENIDACLAVDALYFKPDFKITKNDCISGSAFFFFFFFLKIFYVLNFFKKDRQKIFLRYSVECIYNII